MIVPHKEKKNTISLKMNQKNDVCKNRSIINAKFDKCQRDLRRLLSFSLQPCWWVRYRCAFVVFIFWCCEMEQGGWILMLTLIPVHTHYTSLALTIACSLPFVIIKTIEKKMYEKIHSTGRNSHFLIDL